MKRMLLWFSVGLCIGGCAASHTQTVYGEGEKEPSSTATSLHEVSSLPITIDYAKRWSGEYEGEADVYLMRENRWLRNKRIQLSIREYSYIIEETSGPYHPAAKFVFTVKKTTKMR